MFVDLIELNLLTPSVWYDFGETCTGKIWMNRLLFTNNNISCDGQQQKKNKTTNNNLIEIPLLGARNICYCAHGPDLYISAGKLYS